VSEPRDPALGEPPLFPEVREGSPFWRLRGAIRTLRPHQWVKNLFVLAPVVFAKHLPIRPSFGARSARSACSVFSPEPSTR
jgi:decaprenyl-phosphate phosphoribosyltransferase